MRAWLGLLIVPLLVACGSTAVVKPSENGAATTLKRWDGRHVLLEDFRLNRSLAVDVAQTVYHLEKELLEPLHEHRNAARVLSDVRTRSPSTTRNAERAWQVAEPTLRDGSRGVFMELGAYMGSDSGGSFAPVVGTMEGMVARMLREHGDENPAGVMLAAWRQFSPATVERRPGMLAAAWQFELEYPEAPAVAVTESLLGPHLRSRLVQVPDTPFPLMRDRVDGYDSLLVPLDLLSPGPGSPVLATLDALAEGGGVMLAPGDREHLSEGDRRFLRSALSGLSNGAAKLSHVPAGTRRLTALFSYLVNNAEARALLQFERNADGTWVLLRLEYQPAAASLTGNPGATVDLMPLLRGTATLP
jgi:hypothetical protein